MTSERTAILGFGVTGQSVARYLMAQPQGSKPIVLDTRAPLAVAEEFAGLDITWEQAAWPEFGPDTAVTRAVVSPGLTLDSCLVAGAQAAGVELVSDIDLFFEALADDAAVVAITGTNGKSTVTAWAGHVLSAAGLNCAVGGNLGDAALDLLQADRDIYVLELSSFQLERSGELPLAAATVLNVTEDHLDMHGDMAAYRASKQRIFTAAERLVYNRECAGTRPQELRRAVSFGLDAPVREQDWGVREIAGAVHICRGDMAVMAAGDLPLPGEHNLLNALAVCALVEPWVDVSDLPAALKSFAGLPHRYQRVAERAGVTYINDSKATNLGATVAALAGLAKENRIVLIAGGDPKGVDLSPLAALMPGRVKYLVCLGMAAEELAALAASTGIDHGLCVSMADAVAQSARVANAGDIVLLSPACASLDMFANFAERGDQFAEAARALPGNGSGEAL